MTSSLADSSICKIRQGRRGRTDARAHHGIRGQDVRSREDAARRSDAQPALLRATQEWYTLSENLYRAYRLTGNELYRKFGDDWRYTAYWAKFEKTASQADAHGVHAYSHTNAFSSVAMTYDVTRDVKYPTILRNGYDYLQGHRAIRGGYGPNSAHGHRRRVGPRTRYKIRYVRDVLRIVGGLNMALFLIQFTGEARYGDWISVCLQRDRRCVTRRRTRPELLLQRLSRRRRHEGVSWDTYTCCSGTYIQNLAEYHNLIYFRDARGLFVNLYLPSEVTWHGPAGDVTLRQETDYPDAETTKLTVTTSAPVAFPLRLRVPSWTSGLAVKVNGAVMSVDAPARFVGHDRSHVEVR